MNATSRIAKIAVRRDPEAPIGQPAEMHMICPCGTKLPAKQGEVICPTCRSMWSANGWSMGREQFELLPEAEAPSGYGTYRHAVPCFQCSDHIVIRFRCATCNAQR